MATTPEGKVKAEIKKYLLSLGSACWYCIPNAGGYGTGGIPDFLICYKGLFLAVEAKKPGNLNGATPLQVKQIAGINMAQGWAIVADDVKYVREAIELFEARLAVMRRTGAFESAPKRVGWGAG